MSMESFNQKVKHMMEKKFEMLRHYDLNSFLRYDKDFLFIICFAYMCLSKEEIIYKDINDKSDDRLHPMIDTKEVDRLFEKGFAPRMPIIREPLTYDSVWLLDCIRDTIAHAKFDIEEKRGRIFLKNDGFSNGVSRVLKGELPFEWIMAYANSDILSKKSSDNYTFSGFYYDKELVNQEKLNTKEVIKKGIVYEVNVSGNRFSVLDIEDRIKELFLLYSKEDITDEMIQNLKKDGGVIDSSYNEKHFISFELAKKKVIETLEKEFPDINVNISVNSQKNDYIYQVENVLPSFFNNYDTLFSMINEELSSRGTLLLRVMKRLINYYAGGSDLQNSSNKSYVNGWYKKVIEFHKLLTGIDLVDLKEYDSSMVGCAYYKDVKDLIVIHAHDFKMLQSVCLSIYGLTSLVINHPSLSDEEFLSRDPEEFGIRAYKIVEKGEGNNYFSEKTSIIKSILDGELKNLENRKNFNACKEPPLGLIEAIKKCVEIINSYTFELYDLDNNKKFEPILRGEGSSLKKLRNLRDEINMLLESLYMTKDDLKKIEIITSIKEKINELEVLERKSVFVKCNMSTALDEMRNCFAHIGRINIGNPRGEKTLILFTDYSDKGNRTGEVMCSYGDLMELLSSPYVIGSNRTKK